MYCHEEIALKVAAFALQAEKGNYDALEKRHGYFRPEDYLPEKVRRESHFNEGEHRLYSSGGRRTCWPLHYSCSSRLQCTDCVDRVVIVLIRSLPS